MASSKVQLALGVAASTHAAVREYFMTKPALSNLPRNQLYLQTKLCKVKLNLAFKEYLLTLCRHLRASLQVLQDDREQIPVRRLRL